MVVITLHTLVFLFLIGTASYQCPGKLSTSLHAIAHHHFSNVTIK